MRNQAAACGPVSENGLIRATNPKRRAARTPMMKASGWLALNAESPCAGTSDVSSGAAAVMRMIAPSAAGRQAIAPQA